MAGKWAEKGGFQYSVHSSLHLKKTEKMTALLSESAVGFLSILHQKRNKKGMTCIPFNRL
ncbi:hypothetical protein PcPA57_04190 [Pasteurella canis]|nr:hypothetical protein PcPA57_04190 [Pasteurella canis]